MKRRIVIINSFIKLKGILFITAFCFSFVNISAQQKNDTLFKKSIFKKLWGEKLESGIVFMPIGSHTTAPDVFDVWYTSYNYNNLEIAIFKNSFSDWTLGALYKRAWYLSKKFHIAYGGGIVYGYKGKLKTVKNVPFKNSFLFTGPINPIIGIDVDYKISKKISIHSSISPLIIIYGLKYYL